MSKWLDQEVFRIWLPLVALSFVVLIHLVFTEPLPHLAYAVPSAKLIPYFETPYYYSGILFFSMIFPFLLSFDRKVGFFRYWKPLYMATLPLASLFIFWDILFTKAGVWDFNPNYYLGIKIFGLPLEEWAWFFVIPYCCVFIYECLRAYFNPQWHSSLVNSIFVLIIAVSLYIAIRYEGRIYTMIAFSGVAIISLAVLYYGEEAFKTRFLFTFLVSLIPFVLVDGALTGAFTLEPVVLYSPDGFMGVRLISIPLEDAAYLWSYLLGILWLYDFFKKNS